MIYCLLNEDQTRKMPACLLVDRKQTWRPQARQRTARRLWAQLVKNERTCPVWLRRTVLLTLRPQPPATEVEAVGDKFVVLGCPASATYPFLSLSQDGSGLVVSYQHVCLRTAWWWGGGAEGAEPGLERSGHSLPNLPPPSFHPRGFV